MNIHEYQAKGLLAKFGVAVPRGAVAYSADEAEAAARTLGGAVWVVKAQIHAGGRGKAGGVKIAKSPAEVRELAGKMLGMTLVTKQTGPAGKEVKRVYVEDGCDIKRELYLGMLIDRATVAHHRHGLDRGRHGHRGGRGQPPREDHQGRDRSGDRAHALPCAPHRLRPRARGHAGRRRRPSS